jgi:hypothetical protein
MLPCCQKARAAFQAAINKGKNGTEVIDKWNTWVRVNRNYLECIASKVSLDCAYDEIVKNDCGCSTTKCCTDLYDYIGQKKIVMENHCDAAKGKEVLKCPF